MRFRRARVRYSETPIPVTPYQAAQQCWDERIGNARVQAANWRLMAFACLGLALVTAGALIWKSMQSTVTPYVVEVNQLGEVRAVGPADETYRPTDAQIANHLTRFVTDIRSLSIDPIVVRKNWLEAYDFVTDRGAVVLNDYARARDPFGHIGEISVAVEVTSVVRASDSSFQIRWIERAYSGGALTTTERWTAIVSIAVRPPRDEQRLRRNPLGLYINGLNWSRELSDGKNGES
jgi:type IV secretory pathway TrbF-like protein